LVIHLEPLFVKCDGQGQGQSLQSQSKNTVD